MTSQFDFTNAEWSDIAVLAVLVGYAMSKAEDSGRVGTFREIRTLTHSISHEAPDNAAKGLIEAVSTIDVKDRLHDFEEHSAELLGDVAVTACHTISGLLDDKAEADEATAYKLWVLDIGHQVANTAKENGMRVSEAEAALLDRLRVALEL